jgi:hypothetical protein
VDFSASLPTVLKKVADKMARNMMFRVDLCTELTQLVEVASTLPSHVTSASRHSFPASLCQSVGVASAGAGAGAGSGAGTAAAAFKDPLVAVERWQPSVPVLRDIVVAIVSSDATSSYCVLQALNAQSSALEELRRLGSAFRTSLSLVRSVVGSRGWRVVPV